MPDKTDEFVERLYADHGEGLQKYLLRVLRLQQDTADVAQEASLRLLRLANPEAIGAPKTYLFRTALRVGFDYLRRRRQLSVVPLSPEAEGVADDRPTPEQQAIERDALNRVKNISAEMPEKRREIFARHYFDGQSRAEIAAALGISRVTVEQQLRFGLAYCIRRLEEPATSTWPGEQT